MVDEHPMKKLDTWGIDGRACRFYFFNEYVVVVSPKVPNGVLKKKLKPINRNSFLGCQINYAGERTQLNFYPSSKAKLFVFCKFQHTIKRSFTLKRLEK